MISVEFEDGEDVVLGLKHAFAENKVQRATIKSVEGKIKDLDLSIFIGGQFKQKHFDGEFKVTSIHGVFLEKGNMGYKGEVVVSLADIESNSLGGTLLNAKVANNLTIKADIEEFK